MPRRPPGANTIVAAATRVRTGDRTQARGDLGTRQGWQDEAWSYYDAVPEVKHGVRFRGNSLAKLRLYVATDDPDTGDPVPVTSFDSLTTTQAQAVAELERLRGPLGGQSEIIRESSMNLDVAGEFFIVGWGAREEQVRTDGTVVPAVPETWEVRSVSEVDSSGEHVTVIDKPGDKGRPLDPERDTIIRVWTRHPRWSSLADSPLGGVLGECEALVSLHHQLLAETRSRHNGGVFTVPNELTYGGARPTEDDDDDSDPLTEELHEAFSEPVDNSSSATAWQPTILRGPGEFLKPDMLRWIDLGRTATKELEDRITARVQRLARGLDLPVETTMGHQATTFANAHQVDQDLFDDYLQPTAEVVCDAFTVGFLWPQLADARAPLPEAQRLYVWYDASALIAAEDLSDDADTAFDRDAISPEAYRRAKGFSEDDAPDNEDGRSITDVERLARISQQLYLAVGTIYTTDEVRSLLNDAGAGLTGPGPESSTEGDNAVDDEATAAVVAAAGEPVGRRLLDIDRDLRARLLVLADATMSRALERAGNRLRGHAPFRAQLRQVQPRLAAATLGQALVADAFSDDDLLAEAFTPMREQFMAWGAGAQSEALEIVGQVVGGFSLDERRALGLRQADSLDEAWEWLESTLRSLAAARLFDPTFGVDEVGEAIAGLSVPPGMIREAMARAGGAAGIETSVAGGAWVTIGDAGTRPVGGIALGELMRDLLRDGGASVEGYRWVYGPAARRTPFEPHMRLNGRTFAGFDDPVLANNAGWPPFAYFMPGDHRGCLCDVEPVIISPDGTVAEDF